MAQGATWGLQGSPTQAAASSAPKELLSGRGRVGSPGHRLLPPFPTPPLPPSTTPVRLALPQEGRIWAPLPAGRKWAGSQFIPDSPRSRFGTRHSAQGLPSKTSHGEGPPGRRVGASCLL